MVPSFLWPRTMGVSLLFRFGITSPVMALLSAVVAKHFLILSLTPLPLSAEGYVNPLADHPLGPGPGLPASQARLLT